MPSARVRVLSEQRSPGHVFGRSEIESACARYLFEEGHLCRELLESRAHKEPGEICVRALQRHRILEVGVDCAEAPYLTVADLVGRDGVASRDDRLSRHRRERPWCDDVVGVQGRAESAGTDLSEPRPIVR